MNSLFKYIKVIFINLLILTFSIVILETSLHFFGYLSIQDFKYHIPNYKPIEELKINHNYYTDSLGIFKANPNGEWPSDIIINQDGFRSTSFQDTSKTKQNRILLLGDSFTWGAKAKPFSKSFADLLAKNHQDHTFYNTGIGGVAPNQYAKVAETYLPKLNPGKVFVFFYMGNDLITESSEKRIFPLNPHEKLFHVTNAGWYFARYQNEYIADPIEAYQLHLNSLENQKWYKWQVKNNINDCIGKRCKIKSLMSYSILGTLLLNKFKQQKNNAVKSKGPQKEYSFPKHLRQIQELCNKYESEFHLFIIPYQAQPIPKHLFEGFNPKVINNLSLSDYKVLPDGHFNNDGHYKFYSFIKQFLKKDIETDN